MARGRKVQMSEYKRVSTTRLCIIWTRYLHLQHNKICLNRMRYNKQYQMNKQIIQNITLQNICNLHTKECYCAEYNYIAVTAKNGIFSSRWQAICHIVNLAMSTDWYKG